MQMTQPRDRIKYAGKELARYEEDVDSAADRPTLEDLIAKANFVFDLIMRLDVQISKHVMSEAGRDDWALQDEILSALGHWMGISLKIVPEGEGGHVDGLDMLKENLARTKSIHTPDDEFFDPDALSPLRDEAIEAHRLGMTEPLLGNERR
jgi:hypothetical protein